MQLTANGKGFHVHGNRKLIPSRQILLTMKFTVLLLITAALGASARSTAQVNLSEKKAKLEKVLQSIKKQSGYTLFYDDELVKQKGRPVDVDVRNVPVTEALKLVFRDQVLTYEIAGTTIIVKEKEVPKSVTGETISVQPQAPSRVHGRVTDEKGEPVVGVSISIKGGKIVGVTDNNGEFVLNNVADDAVLVFSAVTIETFETKLNGRTELALSMKTKVSALDEVQIIAYGQTSKRLQTGNVTTVKGEDIAKQPVSNPLLALQGRVPGLFVTQTSGLAGGAVNVRIQGQNSIVRGNEPFYVIDGVPYTSELLTTTIGGPLTPAGVAANGYGIVGSPLNYIDPNLIESIEVLKDADATAIYGSRAANGAILITTKKGKAGKQEIKINVQQGWSRVIKELPLLNTQEYLALRKEAYKNENATPTASQYDINGFWDTTRSTNWQKELIGNTARNLQFTTSLSGGSAATHYNVNANFNRNETVFPNNPTHFRNERGALNINLKSEVIPKRFSFQLTANYLFDNSLLPQSDPTLRAMNLVPTAPALFNADGSLNWMPNSSGASTWQNPLAELFNTYDHRTRNLIGNFVLKYKLSSALEFSSSFGYSQLQTKEFLGNPIVAYKPEQWASRTRSATYTISEIKSWIAEPQLSFWKKIGPGKIDALAGMTFQRNDNNGEILYAEGFSDDALLKNISSATTIVPARTDISTYKYTATFARLGYNISDKYLLNLNARRDGSTRFGPENRFHNFSSIAAAWIFSGEKFSKSIFPVVSFGKVRASYGTTGSDQIGDYSYFNLYSPIAGISVPYQGTGGLTINGLFNPYLQWEETRKMQFGLDLGLFHDKIVITANYVRNRSSNQLLGYSLPIVAGSSYFTSNLPATVQNTAVELSISSTNIKRKDFDWTTSGNLTIPNNKLIAFPGLEASAYSNSLILGKPITITKLFHEIGVNSQTGVYEFSDSKGNSTYTPSYETDLTSIIDRAPKFYGGIENAFRYKRFRLDFLFQFVKQMGMTFQVNGIPGRYVAGSINGINQPTTVIDRWRKPGDIATIMRSVYDLRYSAASSFHSGSDAVWGDASFIRLKNLSFSWQLPAKAIEKLTASDISLFVQGQNLLTFTNYQGLDPESKSSTSLPPLKVLTVGINVIF